ncbi:alpha-amylase family glycosyl hydrolase [Sphingomonas sp. IW22]|uniref:alpha-amylase family glycosyl hydrolase n=1 Tax=Sphingomonas sp. IW22 TaxID=3242489 RepID=UPI003522D14A
MTRAWWRGAVLYQIYPRSFQDSNSDGVGDLPGITARLPYLAELGVDAVWISPIFPSPMADFGYDVADYCGVDPRFGTLADFDALLARAHELGLKVLLDFVPNHSSDQHPWFVESRASRHNPKRDWYIWRDPAPDGGPPNNWISDFGGPAWEYDAATGQYYSHAFLKEQPDLNWRNPDLRAAMMDVLRFWFDRGVDGFRIDVLWHMVKHPDFPDNPPNPDYRKGMGEMWRVLQLHSTDQPEVHDIAAEMRAIADGYGERLLIGEIYLPVERLMHYYGSADAPGVHLPFNFQLIDAPWDARALATLIEAYELALPGDGWPNWVLGNHDRPRAATRFGAAQARVAAMLLLTLRGTPTLYYGDELGVADVAIPPERVTDPRELREPGLGLGRDPVRTPMAWNDEPHGGFSTMEPWLPLHPDWRTRNVATQRGAAESMWRLHRDLLALRRATPALATGDWHPVHADDAVLAYERRQGEQRVLVALNLTNAAARLELPEWARSLSPRMGTLANLSAPDGEGLTLKPDEGLILA